MCRTKLPDTICSADVPLSEGEVAEGLKEALITGSKNASSILSAVDGYYGDELVKILLPEEASVIIDNLAKIPGGDKLVEDVVLSINRAAEDAAKEVAPIFINSIKQMTINDAFGILNGADNAATQYLSNTTRQDLYNLIQTQDQAIHREGYSWRSFCQGILGCTDRKSGIIFANSIAGKLAGVSPVKHRP